MEKHITKINNKRIYDFYKNNPSINIEALNLLLLDFIENINTDLTKTLQNTLTQEILNNVKDIKNELSLNHQNILIKIHDINKDYSENIKNLIQASNNTNLDKISHTLDNLTEKFILKIHEIIPEHNQEIQTVIREQLSLIKTFLNENIQKIENKDTLKDFLSTIDIKLQSIQTPIISHITANQSNLTNKLNHLQETNVIAQSNQDKIMTELGDFLNKYKTSSSLKGQFSENRLEILLHQIFKDAEIVNTSALKASGDFIMKRINMPNVLFENKDYKTNVNIDEVRKFLRDVNEQKCHGVFISQHSGIVGKTDFFIEIHDGCILIYLHDVDYSPDKIKTAVNIIDNLYPKLQQISHITQSGTVIKKEIMDCINNEYQLFLTQKENIINLNKDYTKKFQAMVDDLKFPSLQCLLNENYASIQNQEWVCDVCGECFSRKISLASHKKVHRKKTVQTNDSDDESIKTSKK